MALENGSRVFKVHLTSDWRLHTGWEKVTILQDFYTVHSTILYLSARSAFPATNTLLPPGETLGTVPNAHIPPCHLDLKSRTIGSSHAILF